MEPVHTRSVRSWRITEITPDFRSYGVFDLPTPGGPDDFPRLVRLFAEGETSDNPSGTARLLFAARWKIGALLGWDKADAGVGRRVVSLRDRLPSDLRLAPRGPAFSSLPFTSVYLLADEWAAELANRTVHGVLHLRWVPGEAGGYHGQMAVLAKPNGLLGRAYMAAIAPFRHLLVYPPLLRGIGRDWHLAQSAGTGDGREPGR